MSTPGLPPVPDDARTPRRAEDARAVLATLSGLMLGIDNLASAGLPIWEALGLSEADLGSLDLPERITDPADRAVGGLLLLTIDGYESGTNGAPWEYLLALEFLGTDQA